MKENIKTKVIPFNITSVPIQNNGIIDLETHREETIMSNNTYSKNEIDLKLDKISSEIRNSSEKSDLKFEALMKESSIKFQAMHQKIDNGFKQVDLKFEKLEQKIDFSIQHILSETKNMLIEQQLKDKIDREKERKSTNRWLFGIAISLAGLIVSIIVNFFLRK